jgi:hypothetical protein
MSKVGHPNESLVKLVEDALALRNSHGRTAAATLLSQGSLPFSVIVRVLSEPGKQRPACQMREDTEAL